METYRLTELLSKMPPAKRQEARDIFTTDFILMMESIKVRPTVEQRVSRILSSIGFLLGSGNALVRIDDTRALMVVTRENITRIDFMDDSEVIVSLTREAGIVWELPDRYPKKIDFMQYELSKWSREHGSLQDRYVALCLQMERFQAAYQQVLG